LQPLNSVSAWYSR